MDRDLDAAVLNQVLEHLRERPQIQNIDMMNLTGFCRNCLAKWRHKAARQLGVSGATYEDSLTYVYGMPYQEYKEKFQVKATEEQMAKFTDSNQHHAPHVGFDSSPVPPSAGLRSSVCCEDVRDTVPTDTRVVPSIPASLVDHYNTSPMSFAILTVSDRAFNKVYEDESGPALVNLIRSMRDYQCVVTHQGLVPDEIDAIATQLKEWSNSVDVILTTGGTGLSSRDVTPEATCQVLDKKVPGISEMLRRETSKNEPLSWLSRNEAGVRASCLIVNTPGHPKAAVEFGTCLLPILPRIVHQNRS